MEPSQENSFSRIQYYKETDAKPNNSELTQSEAQDSIDNDNQEILTENSEDTRTALIEKVADHDSRGVKADVDDKKKLKSTEVQLKAGKTDTITAELTMKNVKVDKAGYSVGESEHSSEEMVMKTDSDLEEVKPDVPDATKGERNLSKILLEEHKLECTKENECAGVVESENQSSNKKKKRKVSEVNADAESVAASNASAEDVEGNEDGLESEYDDEDEGEEETGNKPRRRGRCKKNPDIIPSHLSSDIVLGYKILLKFLETPQFSGFHKPFKRSTETEDCKITCLNQIKKKFEENSYNKVCEFVNDVREMLINIYESRNPIAIKKALRLEQILEQRIAQLPNYLRPQCALVLSPDEVNNCHNKIRITKGGGFVSLLLEKTEKKRYEKNREKRKMMAEERKQLKEEQDKDVQEWEKNVLLKDFEEEIKSMWELPAIGHFIHLCADILNIGEVAQFEVERMLLMPQCSDTLDLIMTALLTNSLVRAKLDRTPSMPYSIWAPLVRTRVVSWYRSWHREGRNEQKLFEEIGIEPEFWQILGPDINPLDYYYFHEISLLQRVWILKTLCDVDFVRKKTVHDNIRAQTLDELNPVHLGLDQQGNRYIQFKQFSGSDLRIYRQSSKLEEVTPSELIESIEGFEHREGPITAEKVFRDIWELNEKPEIKVKKKKLVKTKRAKSFPKVTPEPFEKKNLRRSARAKQKTYVDWSDSDQSDTDLNTLKNKLTKVETESLYRPFSEKEFISLTVFRLPRDKVSKPTPKKSSYTCRRTEEPGRSDGPSGEKAIKTEFEDRKEDVKSSCCEDELSDSLDTKQMRDIRMDFEKIFQGNAVNGDEFDLAAKISELDSGDMKFSVKNLENLKMVLKKGATLGEDSKENISCGNENVKTEENSSSTRDKEYDSLYKYNVPNHLKPDSSKFYLVVDSVEGLRQLISKFGSHENDLEIITRSTKSKKKTSHSSTSCEVQLIDRLQNLLVELEPWELDLMKAYRTNKEKMYKEYMNFINRPSDFVHPNEAYWMKTYEEPPTTTASSTTTTTTTTTTTADGNATNVDKSGKEGAVSTNEPADSSQPDTSLDCVVLRKRTRVTRLQLQPETDDLDDDFDDGDDYESNESDDNWVLPTPKKRTKKETTSRTPKLPKRSSSRRTKSLPSEKTDPLTSPGEKSQNSSPDKTKKALFWGPRSSDPSEDLNWETNRQKILEQHNSPVKKVLFKSDDIINDMIESEKTTPQKCDNPSTSVITSSQKVRNVQIPGNKKPYFSSAQLKILENDAMKEEAKPKALFTKNRTSIPKSEGKTIGRNTSPDNSVNNFGSKFPRVVQTYSRVKKAVPKEAEGCQPANTQPPPKQVVVGSKVDASGINSQQVVKVGPQIVGQIQGTVNQIQVANQKIQNVAISSGGLQQNTVGHAQILQPVTRVQQIQIQEPPDQIPGTVATSVGNVRMQQPVQWQQKIISVQTVNQGGKIVQQPVQTQAQVQIQGQPQVQLQNQSQVQVQGQVQQVIRLEPQKLTAVQHPVQIQADKLGTVLQTSSGNLTTENDLYITDGKHLIKFDNNFVQQYLQKDKVLTLDMKKTLLLVKPKPDSGPSTNQSQSQTPTSQQNILVINKPTGVQQTVAPTSVPNFVIPGNYIIKEGNQIQSESEPQTVKIVQQPPAYVIQQKSAMNKGPQTQVIKIITTQPMGTNQNVILSPANISMAGQVIQSVNQTVMAPNQQTKPPTTLRFMRPQIATSTALSGAQNKMNPVQSPIIVNNIVQIQGQRFDAPKPQNSVVAGRIVSTAVPAVRMSTPVQTQTVIPTAQINPSSVGQLRLVTGGQPPQQIQTQTVAASASLNPQVIRPATSVIAQPMRLATVGQGQSQNQIPVTSGSASSQLIGSVSNANTQSIRITTGAGLQQLQTQTIVSSASLNQATIGQPVRHGANGQQTVVSSVNLNSQVVRPATVTNTQPVKMIATTQSQTFIPSSSLNPQQVRSSAPINTQTVRLVTQPQIVQTQTVVSSTNDTSQVVGSTATVNAQSVKIVGVQPQQFQTQTVVSSVNLNPQTVRLATGVNSQPIRFVTTGQSQPVRLMTNNNVGVRFINRNVTPVKATVITSAAQPSMVAVSNVRPSGIVCQPVRLQAIMQPAGVRPTQNRLQLTPAKKVVDANALANAPIIIVEDEEEDIRILGGEVTEPPVTVDYIRGELSVKKTSQGWKYAVKASNGKDIILTDEQIEERLKANDGVMK